MGERIKMEIFKAGKYPQGKYTKEDLFKIAESYDPEYFKAPAVVGHPIDNEPAFGWVERVWVEDDKLMAELDLHPALAEMVRQGLYKNRSVSLYEYPDGRKYLRHVGFLGAQPPQVKGMKPVELKEEEGAEIKEFSFEFSDREELRKKQLERAKRYGIAPKPDGHLTKPAEYANLSDEQFADPVNYKYPIDEAHIRAALSYWGQERNRKGYTKKEQEIISKRIVKAAKKFGINTSLEKEVSNMGEKHFSEEDVQKLLQEERERLKKEFAEKEKSFEEKLKEKDEELRRLQEEKIEAEIRQFVEEKKKEGKLLPKHEADVMTFMKELKKQEDTVNFSEGKQKSMYEWFKEFIEALPVQVPAGEIGKGETVKDPVEKEIRNYMEKHKVDYKTAVIELSKKKPELFEEK